MVLTETITIERTRDKERFKSLFTQDRLWLNSIDDYTPSKEDYQPIILDSLLYLICKKGDKDIGFAFLVPHNMVMWEIHIGFLSDSYECGKNIIDWVWNNTGCKKIIGRIPEYNKLALKFAQKMSFKKEGILSKSFQKDEELHDLHIYGLNKGVL